MSTTFQDPVKEQAAQAAEEQIISAIEAQVVKLAETYPSAVYDPAVAGDDCLYALGTVTHGPEEDEGCLVGQAIQRAFPEVDVDDLDMRHGSGTNIRALLKTMVLENWESWGLDELLEGMDPMDFVGRKTFDAEDTGSRLAWLNYVQGKQDEGETWGHAVEHANSIQESDVSATKEDTPLYW